MRLLSSNKAYKISAISGQTMIEMVVATGMVALVLVAIVSGIALSIRNSRFSKNKALAIRYAHEAVEKFRNYRDEVGWEPFIEEVLEGSTDVDFCLPTMPTSAIEVPNFTGACAGEKITNTLGSTEFVRGAHLTVQNQSNPNDTVEMTVTVTWLEGSKTHSSVLVSRLNSWEL